MHHSSAQTPLVAPRCSTTEIVSSLPGIQGSLQNVAPTLFIPKSPCHTAHTAPRPPPPTLAIPSTLKELLPPSSHIWIPSIFQNPTKFISPPKPFPLPMIYITRDQTQLGGNKTQYNSDLNQIEAHSLFRKDDLRQMIQGLVWHPNFSRHASAIPGVDTPPHGLRWLLELQTSHPHS